MNTADIALMQDLDDLHKKVLLACLGNSHGAYEFHFLNSLVEKQAVAFCVKHKLIERVMGDGTSKGFTSRLCLTLRGRGIAEKLPNPDKQPDEEEHKLPE